MTEQKEETKPTKPLTLSTTARAGAAKSSDATQVRQKFSHGRTRAVTVEVKKPVKRAGGRRYYRPDDVLLLRRIRQCLYEQGYTIKGVQKLLREGALKTDDIPRLSLPTTAAAKEGEKVDDMRRELFELRRELLTLREELKKVRG